MKKRKKGEKRNATGVVSEQDSSAPGYPYSIATNVPRDN